MILAFTPGWISTRVWPDVTLLERVLLGNFPRGMLELAAPVLVMMFLIAACCAPGVIVYCVVPVAWDTPEAIFSRWFEHDPVVQ
jgi:hypothetical protein